MLNFEGHPSLPYRPFTGGKKKKKKNSHWRASFHHPDTAAVRKLQHDICMQDISL